MPQRPEKRNAAANENRHSCDDELLDEARLKKTLNGFAAIDNTHARRVLVEGAWAYRSPAKVSRHLQLRLEKQPKVIQDIS